MRAPAKGPVGLLLALLLAAAACERAGSADERPLVVVSVLPQRWLVERLAGDAVRVTVMLPPGANPVTHEPTIAQLRALEQAALYVRVGHPAFPFERAWLERLLDDFPQLRVVDPGPGGGTADEDPHVWLSPERVAQQAERLAAVLAELAPEERAQIERREAALQREIEALDAELRRILAEAGVRRFWVLHPAWGHFARAYDLEQVALEHEGKEPDARRLRELLARAREQPPRIVFVQPQFDRSAARALAGELGAELRVLDPLAPDWADNLRRVARALAAAAAPSPQEPPPGPRPGGGTEP